MVLQGRSPPARAQASSRCRHHCIPDARLPRTSRASWAVCARPEGSPRAVRGPPECRRCRLRTGPRSPRIRAARKRESRLRSSSRPVSNLTSATVEARAPFPASRWKSGARLHRLRRSDTPRRDPRLVLRGARRRGAPRRQLGPLGLESLTPAAGVAGATDLSLTTPCVPQAGTTPTRAIITAWPNGYARFRSSRQWPPRSCRIPALPATPFAPRPLQQCGPSWR